VTGPPRRAAAALAAVVLLACSSAEDDDAARPQREYVAKADAVCQRGRDRMHADPSALNSTDVLEEMETALRELGDPPSSVASISADVPFALAIVTWSAESFNVAGRYDLYSEVVTVDELRRAGFKACGRA
jgi:hypothetical protein